MLGHSWWEPHRPFHNSGWKECPACWEIQALFVNANRKQTWQETDRRAASISCQTLPFITDKVFGGTAASPYTAVYGPRRSNTPGTAKNPDQAGQTVKSVWDILRNESLFSSPTRSQLISTCLFIYFDAPGDRSGKGFSTKSSEIRVRRFIPKRSSFIICKKLA